MQTITGFTGSIGFAILFNIRGKKMLFASLGGLICYIVFIAAGFITASEPTCCFFAAAAISIYSEVLARVLKTPTTTFLMTALVPLIPGGALYRTVKFAFEGNRNAASQNGIYTMQIACALAIGIIVIASFTSITKKIMAAKSKNPNIGAA